jgi:hypothetical protein
MQNRFFYIRAQNRFLYISLFSHFNQFMDFVLLQVFTNYIEAHIVKGRLQDQGINCWLEGEHLSALIVDPILTNVIAGIKLMVAKDDVEKALEILNRPEQYTDEVGEEEE